MPHIRHRPHNVQNQHPERAIQADFCGAQMEDICRIKVWVTDRAYIAPVMAVVGRHLRGIPVASSELIIDGLAQPEMLMEIDVDLVRS